MIGPHGPAYASYMWLTVTLNAAAWLARVVPAAVRGGPPAYLRGTGLTTSVVYVQDLALWLPLLAVAAAWLWCCSPGDGSGRPGDPCDQRSRSIVTVSRDLCLWLRRCSVTRVTA